MNRVKFSKRDLLALLILLFICIGVMWRFFLRGEVPLNADWLVSNFEPWKKTYGDLTPQNPELDDPILNIYPLRLEGVRQWGEGRVPLWNPYILCGTPLLADNASFPLDPLNILGVVFGMPSGYALLIFFQLVVCGAGFYLFLRSIGAGQPGAFLSAIVAILNGTFAVWLEYGFWLGAVCWLPWALFLFELSRKHRWLAPPAGGLVGLCFLSGQLQISLYIFAFASLYALISAIVERRLRRFVGFLAMGLLVCGAQVLPTIELVRFSPRTPMRYYETNPLKPVELLSFIAPDIFGDPVHGYVGVELVELSYVARHGGYIGILPLLLCFFALRGFGWRELYFAIVAFGTVVFLLLLGTPLQRMIIHLFPAFGALHARRMIILFVLGAGVLSGLGWERADGRLTGKALLLLALCPFGLLLLSFTQMGDFIAERSALRASVITLLSGTLLLIKARNELVLGALLLTLVIIELYLSSWWYSPFTKKELVYPDSESVEWIKKNFPQSRVSGIERGDADMWKGDVLPPDTALPFRLFDIRGKESLHLSTFFRLMERVDGRGVPFLATVHLSLNAHLTPLFDRHAVELILSPKELDVPWFEKLHSSDLFVYRNLRAEPRLALRTPDGGKRKLNFLFYEPTELVSEVDEGGTLSIAETSYPGWRAFSSGKETELRMQRETVLMELDAGEGELRIFYAPKSFLYGLLLTLAGLLSLCAFLGAGFGNIVRRK